jgi:hypothetical protein
MFQEGVLFFQKPADPKSNLRLTPTYLYFEIGHVLEDYQLKEWIRAGSVRGEANLWSNDLLGGLDKLI